MNIINRLKLLDIMQGQKKLDAQKILADVDRNAVFIALNRTKKGPPRPFRYTDEPVEEENFKNMAQKDKEKMWAIFQKLHQEPEKVLPDLSKLLKKYPNVPAIFNNITAAYAYLGKTDLQFEMLKKTVTRFPNYLFGKISLAEYYSSKGEHGRIPIIFDRKLQIYEHYPDNKEVFHYSEVRAFYSVIGGYFAQKNKTARALSCYFILNDVDPDHPATKKLANEIIFNEMEQIQNRFTKPKPKKRKQKK